MSEAAFARAMHVVDTEGEIPIRIATRKDHATFKSLFSGFVIDQAGRGGQIAAEERTMTALYEPLFWSYVNKERKGVCLIAGLDNAAGVLLWGDTLSPMPVTVRDGPLAQGWGVYVVPSLRGTGISRRLRNSGKHVLRELGFNRVSGSALVPDAFRDAAIAARPKEFAALESALGAGFRWEEVTGSIYLNEES